MTTKTAEEQTITRKTAKVRLNAVMIRDTTLDHLTKLADDLGKNSAAGLAADILEVIPQIKPENYHIAIAEFIKHGSK
ncbi:hypothetical protein MLD52_12720 [Puniceicoccaceae bacterium K14]|nr:hypothetical protein [Puniceicoccaceae bacterium K14]